MSRLRDLESYEGQEIKTRKDTRFDDKVRTSVMRDPFRESKVCIEEREGYTETTK